MPFEIQGECPLFRDIGPQIVLHRLGVELLAHHVREDRHQTQILLGGNGRDIRVGRRLQARRHSRESQP